MRLELLLVALVCCSCIAVHQEDAIHMDDDVSAARMDVLAATGQQQASTLEAPGPAEAAMSRSAKTNVRDKILLLARQLGPEGMQITKLLGKGLAEGGDAKFGEPRQAVALGDSSELAKPKVTQCLTLLRKEAHNLQTDSSSKGRELADALRAIAQGKAEDGARSRSATPSSVAIKTANSGDEQRYWTPKKFKRSKDGPNYDCPKGYRPCDMESVRSFVQDAAAKGPTLMRSLFTEYADKDKKEVEKVCKGKETPKWVKGLPPPTWVRPSELLGDDWGRRRRRRRKKGGKRKTAVQQTRKKGPWNDMETDCRSCIACPVWKQTLACVPMLDSWSRNQSDEKLARKFCAKVTRRKRKGDAKGRHTGDLEAFGCFGDKNHPQYKKRPFVVEGWVSKKKSGKGSEDPSTDPKVDFHQAVDTLSYLTCSTPRMDKARKESEKCWDAKKAQCKQSADNKKTCADGEYASMLFRLDMRTYIIALLNFVQMAFALGKPMVCHWVGPLSKLPELWKIFPDLYDKAPAGKSIAGSKAKCYKGHKHCHVALGGIHLDKQMRCTQRAEQCTRLPSKSLGEGATWGAIGKGIKKVASAGGKYMKKKIFNGAISLFEKHVVKKYRLEALWNEFKPFIKAKLNGKPGLKESRILLRQVLTGKLSEAVSTSLAPLVIRFMATQHAGYRAGTMSLQNVIDVFVTDLKVSHCPTFGQLVDIATPSFVVTNQNWRANGLRGFARGEEAEGSFKVWTLYMSKATNGWWCDAAMQHSGVSFLKGPKRKTKGKSSELLGDVWGRRRGRRRRRRRRRRANQRKRKSRPTRKKRSTRKWNMGHEFKQWSKKNWSKKLKNWKTGNEGVCPFVSVSLEGERGEVVKKLRNKNDRARYSSPYGMSRICWEGRSNECPFVPHTNLANKDGMLLWKNDGTFRGDKTEEIELAWHPKWRNVICQNPSPSNAGENEIPFWKLSDDGKAKDAKCKNRYIGTEGAKARGLECVVKYTMSMDKCSTCCCKGGLIKSDLKADLIVDNKWHCKNWFTGYAEPAVQLFQALIRSYISTQFLAPSCYKPAWKLQSPSERELGDNDSQGRRGGGGMSAGTGFVLSSGNRAGNSERLR